MSDSESKQPKSKRSFSLRALLLLVTLVALGLFAKQLWDDHQKRKMLAEWIDQIRQSEVISPYSRNAPNPLACPTDLEKEEQLALLLYGAVKLDEEFEQMCCLKILAEHFPVDAKEPLTRIALRSNNEATQAAAIHLLGFIRDENILPRLLPILDDPHSTETVKNAVLECIGFTHMPSYRLMRDGLTQLDSAPSISPNQLFSLPLEEKADIVLGNQPAPPPVQTDFTEYYFYRHRNEYLIIEEKENVSLDYRDILLKNMLGTKSNKTRHAAARALLSWPPEDYQLRVAEWGVWLNDNGKMKLAKSSIDRIPDFVHNTGNELSEFKSRVNTLPRGMFIDKPVFHITTDQPMVLDIDVRINQGRPWFAYPIPDDFSIDAWAGKTGTSQSALPPAKGQPLTDIGEGYPWLLPRHRQKHSLASPTLSAVGLRWQSLIVTPEKLDHLQLPTVSADPKYEWWKRLRQVESSYIANKNETEKFLYYDGPTMAQSPLKFEFTDEETLELTHQPIFDNTYEFNVDKKRDLPPSRSVFFVRVAAGTVTGHRLEVNENRDVAKLETHSLSDADVLDQAQLRTAIKRQLNSAGLNDSESDGLMGCWQQQWFETPGERAIFLLTRQEYDKMCPITIRPQPTNFQRVGLVFTELAPTVASKK